MTNLGVDVVGEVNRGGAGGEVNDIALGGERVDSILEDVGLHRVHELAGVGDLLPPLHERPHPGNLGFKGLVSLTSFLVAPVGRDAVLGDAVHLLGADLYLQRLAVFADDCCVQALVHVVLGRRYVVVELARDRLPQPVHDAQNAIAVGNGLGDYADTSDVVDLPVGDVLALHLAVDAVDVLRSARNLCLDVLSVQFASE